MIQTDSPHGAGSPLVRGLAACLSAVTETPLDELPDTDGLTATHAMAVWKCWLCDRGLRIVPLANASSVHGARRWIAIVDRSGSRFDDGFQPEAAVLAFGTPPGVVLSPQDPALLGEATADLDISTGYAVVSLDPCSPRPTQPAA